MGWIVGPSLSHRQCLCPWTCHAHDCCIAYLIYLSYLTSSLMLLSAQKTIYSAFTSQSWSFRSLSDFLRLRSLLSAPSALCCTSAVKKPAKPHWKFWSAFLSGSCGLSYLLGFLGTAPDLYMVVNLSVGWINEVWTPWDSSLSWHRRLSPNSPSSSQTPFPNTVHLTCSPRPTGLTVTKCRASGPHTVSGTVIYTAYSRYMS